MRIISGKFKGRRLVAFDQEHIRPTTDRVKESLFNIIGAYLDGARLLDLFSGTGNLGLEGLSRGAREVQMVELSNRSIQIIKKNLKLLDVSEGVVLHKADAVKFLNSYDDEPFDVILIDPPFPLKICAKVMNALDESMAAGGQTIIAIEHSSREPLDEKIGGLRRVDTRDYGDKLLEFFKKES